MLFMQRTLTIYNKWKFKFSTKKPRPVKEKTSEA
jgi:hypothetical protein